MKRQANWQRGLRDEILKHNQPFAWGTNDCSSFVADCVQAVTGTDVFSEFRGKYTDEKSALKIMHDVAGSVRIEDAMAHVAALHGLKEISPYYAQPGDILLLPSAENNTLMLGIVGHNAKDAHIVAEDGVKRLEFYKVALKAWSIA